MQGMILNQKVISPERSQHCWAITPVKLVIRSKMRLCDILEVSMHVSAGPADRHNSSATAPWWTRACLNLYSLAWIIKLWRAALLFWRWGNLLVCQIFLLHFFIAEANFCLVYLSRFQLYYIIIWLIRLIPEFAIRERWLIVGLICVHALINPNKFIKSSTLANPEYSQKLSGRGSLHSQPRCRMNLHRSSLSMDYALIRHFPWLQSKHGRGARNAAWKGFVGTALVASLSVMLRVRKIG